MKASHSIGLAISAVLITVAIEETRIASLRAHGAASAGDSVSAKSSPTLEVPQGKAPDRPAIPTRSKERPSPGQKPVQPPGEDMAKAARKMMDNPAAKAMMNQGVKMAVAMMYGDLIDGFGLSKDEADYFKTLLGKEIADQQEIGMKMLGDVTDEEQLALSKEITERSKENEEEIKKFLNNDEDYKKYSDYKERLPERQQIDGIRAAMTAKGDPLDKGTESRLLEAMYRSRTESKMPDMKGPEAFTQLASGNMTEIFETSWAAQQEQLNREIGGILNAKQIEAFQEYQKQMKEMHLTGIKIAEQMMPKNSKKAK